MKSINQTTFLALLLLTVAACGGGGSSSSDTSGSGGCDCETGGSGGSGSDTETPEDTQPTGLLVDDIVNPEDIITEFEIYYAGSLRTIEINHTTNEATMVYNGLRNSYIYVPETNSIASVSGRVLFNLGDMNKSMLDYTSLGQYVNYNSDYPFMIGTQPTDPDLLPTVGSVEFEGGFIGHLNPNGNPITQVGEGNSLTTVNFETGDVDATLTYTSGNQNGAVLELENMILDSESGNFEGGEASFTFADGQQLNDVDTETNGGFYGPNGEEVAGGYFVQLGEEGDVDYSLRGTWNGAQ